MRRTLLLVGVITWSLATPLRGGDATIEFFSSAFLPQSVEIGFGETVTWNWISGSHTLTSGTPTGAPGTADEPGTLFSVPLDAANPTFSYTFTTGAGLDFHFFDSQNPVQVGTIEVLGDDETFIVGVVDNVFEPVIVDIFEGDKIRWEHEPGEMLHTATSGLSSMPSDNPGDLFDAILSDASPVFEYVFDQAGVYPYFCLPHEVLGMDGEIRVQDRFTRGDGNRDRQITIADPISTLDHLFAGATTNCGDAHDSNDDGAIDVGDVIYLLTYIFSSGAAPDPPFPAEGPDRTTDSLVCYP